jgi:hypothetical protein
VETGGNMELVHLYLTIHRMHNRRPRLRDPFVLEGFERLSNGMIVPQRPRPSGEIQFEGFKPKRYNNNDYEKQMERTDKIFKIVFTVIAILGVAGIITAALQ